MPRRLALLLALLLAACHTNPVEPERLSGIKSVAIISALSDEVTMRAIGIMVFGNSEQRGALPGFAIDDAVTQRLTAALSPRFELRPVKFNRAALSPDKIYFPGERGLFDTKRRAVEEAVRAEMAGQPADVYLLVSPGAAQYGNTNQGLGGLGVLKMANRYSVYALYWITVIDGSEFKVIGDAKAPAEGFMPAIRGPSRSTDAALWAETPGALRDASKEKLKKDLTDLVMQTLPETVRRLQMGQ